MQSYIYPTPIHYAYVFIIYTILYTTPTLQLYTYTTTPTRIQVQPEQVALLMANPIINKGAVEGRILFIIKNPAIPSPMRHDEGRRLVYECSVVRCIYVQEFVVCGVIFLCLVSAICNT